MSGLFTIIGGGVCGLAMAAELSSRGAQVMVIDPKGAP
ncbi:FAD-dependent oxidoreductase, partial [Tateyamaria sp.]